ncbi:MAG TPA: zinc dependent phospholipase C family protein [Trebonia sp.]|jgi:hypothetical protein|nr:zinc dependent phospholipase C family protein [Trebonia sp.]
MPGTGIHISVMRHVAKTLEEHGYAPPGSERVNPRWTGPDVTRLGRIMADHDNFAALGAHGPDLFFLMPDFRDVDGIRVSSVLTFILEFVEKVYDALDPYISKWEHYLGPISEDTAEEISRLTGGLSETFGDIGGELKGILTTALEDFVTQQGDLWEFFSLGLNKGYDDQAFFWSDIGHYRRTGAFGRALWELADGPEGSDSLRAYALGYLTHLGTDTTAHSFVNSISGGPFRTHWQRHHLVENHMDALWYLQDPLGPRTADQYPQFTESALYYDLAFADDGGVVARPSYPGGDTLRENWERARKLDIDSDLPDEVTQLLLQAIEQLYYADGGPHPKILTDDGRPSAENISESYRLWFRLLKLLTVDGFSHEPPPPPDVFPNLDFPTPSDPSDDPPNSGDSSWWDDILDFVLSVLAVLAYIVEVIAYLASLPWAVLADLITYPFRLAAYYALELPLFHLLKAFRSVLVMTGYLHPMEDEIRLGLVRVGDQDEVSVAALDSDLGDVFGGMSPPEHDRSMFRDPAYPHSHPEDEFKHPWEYPDSKKAPTERCPTTAGPWARLDAPSALFVGVGQDPAIRDKLEEAAGPQDADDVGLSLQLDQHLGDPVEFCKYLIWLTTRNKDQKGEAKPQIVDWNLDSDRGYGYHAWDWNRDANAPSVRDPEGNPYQPPCTWPPQAENPPTRYEPRIPLKLHWTGPGLDDPGCAAEVRCTDDVVILLAEEGAAAEDTIHSEADSPSKSPAARSVPEPNGSTTEAPPSRRRSRTPHGSGDAT